MIDGSDKGVKVEFAEEGKPEYPESAHVRSPGLDPGS